ncbi:MAG: NUDIX domain-containing protein, partial [Gammaproteobacteria bacterium]
VARAEGRQHELPTPRKTKAVPTRERRLLIVRDRQGRVLLERRPNRGIWGGLWSLPEVTDADHADAWCHARVGREVGVSSPGSGFEHRFSHFVLRASTYEVLLPSPCEVVRESDNLAWYDPRGDFSGGIPAPVERFLSDGA